MLIDSCVIQRPVRRAVTASTPVRGQWLPLNSYLFVPSGNMSLPVLYNSLPQDLGDTEEPTVYTKGVSNRMFSGTSSLERCSWATGSPSVYETRIVRALERWALLVAILCAAINIGLFLTSPHSTPSPNFSRLPRPNQYIGLERVNRKALNASSPGPIITFGQVQTQVSMARQKYVFPVDPRRQYFRGMGTVSLDDKQFIVNDTVRPHLSPGCVS